MSGYINFFNCTDEALYYSNGGNNYTPLVIYPMTPTFLWTQEGGLLTFIDKNNNVIGSINEATRYFTVADPTKYSVYYTTSNGICYQTLYSSAAKNPLSWMSDSLNLIGTKTLRQICIPGSHDAGMSVCQNGTVGGHPCNTITQSQNILGQLNLGTRYFDLRPTISGGNYYTGHYTNLGISSQGANGESFSSIIAGINSFTSNTNCKELLIFKISKSTNTDLGNASYRRFTQQEYNTLLQMISSGVNFLYTNTTENIDLTNIALNSMISQRAQVVFVIDDNNPDNASITLGNFQGKGFFPKSAFPLYDEYSDAQDVESMATDQFSKMKRERLANNYFLLSWTLTQNNLQAGTCWLSSAAGTGLGTGAGAGAAGITELFTGLIPGIGIAIGALAGAIGAQVASSEAGTSIRELAEQANINLFSKIAPNLSTGIFPNIIYTDFIENTNPLLLATSINDGSIFKKQNPECLELCDWSVNENSLAKEQFYEYSTVSPTLVARENPLFRQLFRIRRTNQNQLSFNYHVEGPDWTKSTSTNQQSNQPPASAWHNGILFIAYSFQNMVYMINSMNYSAYYHVATAEGICLTGQPTSLVVWNNQLCLAYTDLENNIHVISSTTGLSGALWNTLNVGSSLYATSNFGPSLTTTTLLGTNYLILAFTANVPTPTSVISRQPYYIYFSMLAPGNVNWPPTGNTEISCDCTPVIASVGTNTYMAYFNGGFLYIKKHAENGGPLVTTTYIDLTGITKGVSLFGDILNNRLVLSYSNLADGNSIYLQSYDLSADLWSNAEKLPAQCGNIPTFTQNSDSISLVYVINGSTPYMCQIPGGIEAGWVKEQTLPCSSAFAPAAAWCYHQLYVAYLNDANTVYLTGTSNYSTWSASANTGFTSANPPALVNYNNNLYMAFTANDGSNNILLASMAANGTWSLPTQTGLKSLSTPALAVHNNTLYLAYQSGTGDNSLYVTNNANGKTWISAAQQLTYLASGSSQASALAQTSPNGPTLASHNGNLYLLYTANDASNTVYLVSDKDNWASLTNTGAISRNSPSAVNYNNELLFAVVNRSVGSGSLYPGQTLATGQTLTSNNGLFELQVNASGISLTCTINSQTYWNQALNASNGLYFNTNGNLEGAGAPAGANKYLWQAPAGNTASATRLSVEDDGTMKLYQKNGTLITSFGSPQYFIP